MVSCLTSSQEALIAPDREQREPGALLGVAQRLGGGHLHRLLLDHDLALPVAGDRRRRRRRPAPRRSAEPEGRPEGRRPSSRLVVRPQVPGATRRARSRRRPASAPAMTCGKVASAVTLVSTSQMLSARRGRSPALNRTPTGCCINELAARMKYADRLTPEREQPDATPGAPACGSRSQPKIHSPRKVDSRKNAARPSIASGAPNTSPTKRE